MAWFKAEVPSGGAPLGSLLSSEKETNFGEDASINWIAQESQSSVERIISKKEVIQLYLDTVLYHPKLIFSMVINFLHLNAQDVIQVLSSFFVVILYIWSSYFHDESPTWMNALEYFFAVAFILDFLYQFFAASSK